VLEQLGLDYEKNISCGEASRKALVESLLCVLQEAYEGLLREKFGALPKHWIPEIAKQVTQAKASSAGKEVIIDQRLPELQVTWVLLNHG